MSRHTLQNKSPPEATKEPKEDASRTEQGSADPNQADQVCFFLVIVKVVRIAHVVSGATGDKFISTVNGDSSTSRSTRYFLLPTLLDLRWISIGKDQLMLPFRSGFLHGYFVFARG